MQSPHRYSGSIDHSRFWFLFLCDITTRQNRVTGVADLLPNIMCHGYECHDGALSIYRSVAVMLLHLREAWEFIVLMVAYDDNDITNNGNDNINNKNTKNVRMR